MNSNDRRRRKLYSLLGDLPPRGRKVAAERVAQLRRGDMLIDVLRLDLNGTEPVEAYFVRPAESRGPLPAVLFNHSHGGYYEMGKRELLAPQSYMAGPYAPDLVKRGCAVLCIDHWCFGSRRGNPESQLFKLALWRGQVLWGMMVYDTLKALDYLAARPDVDASRIATLGMSMGSTMAWWAAALDERIKAVVDICCLTDFDALIESHGLDEHGAYYYVPALLKHFSTADINSLIAPRPHLALAGSRDALTPQAGLRRIDRELRRAYRAAGAPRGAWKLSIYDVPHQETPAMRQEALAFLNKWLA